MEPWRVLIKISGWCLFAIPFLIWVAEMLNMKRLGLSFNREYALTTLVFPLVLVFYGWVVYWMLHV